MPQRRTGQSPEPSIRQRLQLFVRRAEQLRSRRVVRGGIEFAFKLDIDFRQKRFVPEFIGPDEEDFKAFMLDFRHFISDNEPTFYLRAVNDCYRCINWSCSDNDAIEGLKLVLQSARTSWLDIMDSRPAIGTCQGP